MFNFDSENLWINTGIFIVGLVFIVKGADLLTNGASSIAHKFNVSTLIIGLTIVAFGTSMPELVVSSISAAKGNSEIAIGNVVGSNIFNTLAIVGITSLLCPIICKKELLKRDIPVNIIVSILLPVLIFCLDGIGILSRMEGITLLIIFAMYLVFTIYPSTRKHTKNTDEIAKQKSQPLWKCILDILLGLAALIIGGDWLVDGASGIALKLGVSDSIIALTIVAAGTSFPELATSIMAAKKNDADMAMGNVVGSNTFNLLFILGVSSVINPLEIGNISIIDFILLVASILLLAIFGITAKRHRINRWHGVVLTSCIIAYYTYLVIEATR